MCDASNIELQYAIKIPLRDGVRLNAVVYMPRGQLAPTPAVFLLTPYGCDTYHERGVYFAVRGVPFVIVDSRGRGNSEGTFRPFIQEAQDGYDVVEWLARQSYCDGRVGMWGGSYNGYVQWAAAKEFPPHLATIVPAAAPHMGTDVPMRCNILQPYMLQWLTLTCGRIYQPQIFGDSALWCTLYRRWHKSGRPFRELSAVAGIPSDTLQEWIAHPRPDTYWDAHNPTTAQYGHINIPILTITGVYDDDQPGALTHYREHLRNSPSSASAQHYLIIGPWDHFGTRTPKQEFGGLKFGPASLLDLPKLHLEWYAWTMQNGPKPTFLRKQVAYYMMGAERWRYADTLEDITSHHRSLFLDSRGNADDVFSAGSLSSAMGEGGPDVYSYDPRDTDGLEVDAEAQADGSSLVYQDVLLALRGKALIYHSAPFSEDTEIGGFFELVAWISVDCPDTDIYVSVHEVCLDGESIQLSTDAIRSRYREGLRNPKLICTESPLRYDFRTFTFVSRRIRRGHRLRLVISPVGRLIQAPFSERNFNGGGVVAEESINDARRVTVRLFHDSVHQSALSMPLAHPMSSDEVTAPVSAYLSPNNSTR
jgi:uncharacterized protein